MPRPAQVNSRRMRRARPAHVRNGDKDKEKVIQDDHVLVYDHQALT